MQCILYQNSTNYFRSLIDILQGSIRAYMCNVVWLGLQLLFSVFVFKLNNLILIVSHLDIFIKLVESINGFFMKLWWATLNRSSSSKQSYRIFLSNEGRLLERKRVYFLSGLLFSLVNLLFNYTSFVSLSLFVLLLKSFDRKHTKINGTLDGFFNSTLQCVFSFRSFADIPNIPDIRVFVHEFRFH